MARNWTEADLAGLVARGNVDVVGETPPLPDETPEGQLLARVRALAEANGFLCYHTYRSTRSEPGFPDLVLTNGVSLIIVELKSNTGKLTREQALWIEMLKHTEKVEVYVWRPEMWGAIVQRLTRKTG